MLNSSCLAAASCWLRPRASIRLSSVPADELSTPASGCLAAADRNRPLAARSARVLKAFVGAILGVDQVAQREVGVGLVAPNHSAHRVGVFPDLDAGAEAVEVDAFIAELELGAEQVGKQQ